MYPNSVYIGLKSGPCLGTLGPKYILFGYMDLFKLSMRKKGSLSTQGLLRNLVVLLISHQGFASLFFSHGTVQIIVTLSSMAAEPPHPRLWPESCRNVSETGLFRVAVQNGRGLVVHKTTSERRNVLLDYRDIHFCEDRGFLRLQDR